MQKDWLTNICLLGALLNSGLELRGSSSKLEFRTHKSNQLEFLCEPHELGQNLYWLSATLAHADSLLAMLMVSSIDYDIMHRHLPIYLWMFHDMHQETHRGSLIYQLLERIQFALDVLRRK